MNKLKLVVLSAVFALLPNLANAVTPLTIEVDQSQLVQLNADPANIVVGNPSIADVSLNGRQLFIHGRSFGETNLMIFNTAGDKIADFSLAVSHNSPAQLSVFTSTQSSGAYRLTYSCAPNCEANMMVGDAGGFFNEIIKDNGKKFDFATGYRPSDVKTVNVQAGEPQ